jgi:hypothetical protein
MNRFRTLSFIDYKDRIRAHKSLLNVVLHDQLPDDNTEKPPIAALHGSRPKRANGSLASSVRN